MSETNKAFLAKRKAVKNKEQRNKDIEIFIEIFGPEPPLSKNMDKWKDWIKRSEGFNAALNWIREYGDHT